MRPRVLLPALLLPVVLCAVPATAGCRHLIVDPAGDANQFGDLAPYPSQVDDPRQVDVRWAELRTTGTHLVATVALEDLEPEGDRNLDHAYSVTFRNGDQAIQLLGMFGSTSSWARASTSAAGDEQPDDGGVYVGRHLGEIKGERDLRRDRVTLTAELSLLGGVSGPLTALGAQAWGALKHGEGGTYGRADRATTTRTYRPGSPDCLR